MQLAASNMEPMTLDIPKLQFDDGSTASLYSFVPDTNNYKFVDVDESASTAASLDLGSLPSQMGWSQGFSTDAWSAWTGFNAEALRAVARPPGLTAPGTQLSSVKDQFSRTRLCTFYAQGNCMHGENCRYAHSDIELQSAPDLSKTKLCFKYFRGQCRDERCTFAHGYNELRATTSFYKTELCFQWSREGRCKASSNCRYAHGQEELRPPGLD